MKDETRLTQLREVAKECAILRKTVVEDLGMQIIEFAAIIAGVIGSGGKVMLAGNGGSAADAQHFAGEMVVRLTADRNRQSLPAIALNTDTVVMTAAANDYGYENVFARQVEGIGSKGDLLIVISTSGNSANLINAVKIAREKKILTAGLFGGKGGQLAGMVDRSIVIPHSSTQRIQEEHTFLIHTLVEMVESDLFG